MDHTYAVPAVQQENSKRYPGEDLLAALSHLDHLLDQAVVRAQEQFRQGTVGDLYRGLHIDLAEVESLLSAEPGVPTLYVDDATAPTAMRGTDQATPRLLWLAQHYRLDPFDIDVILITLAPELDRRYERLYAYLQDHVSRRRPTVDLALNLLCSSAGIRLRQRAHFASDAPLVRHGLLHLIPERDQDHPTLLSYALKLDEQIINLLLHEPYMDRRLASFCQMVVPDVCLDAVPLRAEVAQALPALVVQAWAERQPLRLYFYGPDSTSKRRTAEALAAEVGTPVLVVDLVRALASGMAWERLCQLVLREALFHNAFLYLEPLDALRGNEHTVQYQCLLNALAEDDGVFILAGEHSSVPQQSSATQRSIRVISVFFPMPDFAGRQACWTDSLADAGLSLVPGDLTALAGRFRLTPSQIEEAVTAALDCARWRVASRPQDAIDTNDWTDGEHLPTVADFFAAARAQAGHDLAALAHKIEPLYTWEDIVLPEDALAQLREICARVTGRHRVLGEWGFARKLSQGKGVSVLFAGSSGTGKTMAAEVIANELGLDLYKINLAGVVSKYIGETEKNLDRIFTAAENANAILFFDEADALFGKRSEVRDAHDRYANIEISYLLQKMEQYEGIAILASNLRQNLDDAFTRRLAFTVHFPFPSDTSRRRIWDGIWPAEVPLADDVDLDFLTQQFKLSGGNIKNIALAAAFLAAADGGVVKMTHLFHAVQREYQKLGKVLSQAELTAAYEEKALADSAH